MGLFAPGRSVLKHRDPRKRQQVLLALDAGQQRQFFEVATRDEDPGVRLLAARRIGDRGMLERLRASEDPGVAAAAEERLAALAIDAVKRERGESALRLLELVTTPSSLADVAVRAADDAVRRRAAERCLAHESCDDAQRELIAVRGRDPGPANDAVVGIVRPARLKTVRKKAVLDEVRDAAARRLEERRRAAAAPSGEVLRRERIADLEGLCREAERIADGPDPVPGERPFVPLVEAWDRRLAKEGDPPTGDAEQALERRFALAHQAFKRRLAAAPGNEPPPRRSTAPPVDAPAPPSESARADAAPTVADREEPDASRRSSTVGELPDELAARARDLLARAEAAVELEDLREAEDRLRAVHKDWLAIEVDLPHEHPLRRRFGALSRHLKERRRERREHRRERQEAAEAERRRIVDDLGELAEAAPAADDGRVLRRDLRAIERRWKDAPRLAASRWKPLEAEYRERRDVVLVELRRLESLADWERFARIPTAEALIDEAEALAGREDLENLAGEAKALQRRWRAMGGLPRERNDELWGRFKAACDAVFARLEPFFAARDRERTENLAQKTRILDELEALLDKPLPGLEGSVAAERARDERVETTKRLLEEWRATGHVPRGEQKGLWKRYRHLTARIGEERDARRAERSHEQEANLARKRDLCKEAEDLAAALDTFHQGLLPGRKEADFQRDLVALRRRWRDVGHVPREHKDEVGARFKAACDRVHDGLGDFLAKQEEAQHANLAVKEALLEEFAEYLEEETPRWFREQIGGIRAKWAKVGHVPRTEVRRIRTRWQDLNDRFDRAAREG